MTPERLKYWQTRAHDYACRQGFYDGVDPSDPVFIASRLERIHSEISEAGDCVAKGEMSTDIEVDSWHYDPPKPVGFPIELADVFLRLADFAESLGVVLYGADAYDPPGTTPRELSAALADLHNILAGVQEVTSIQSPFARVANLAARLTAVLCQLQAIAESCGIDLDAMATVKMAYNDTRPRMHGKVI